MRGDDGEDAGAEGLDLHGAEAVARLEGGGGVGDVAAASRVVRFTLSPPSERPILPEREAGDRSRHPASELRRGPRRCILGANHDGTRSSIGGGHGVEREGPDASGLGVGLAICRSIAERHGGRLELAADGGVRATLTLPAVKPAESPS